MPRDHASKEQDAVRTTIVGGRPPGSGQPVGDVPRGIEVLVKKASLDADFRPLLIEKRADAAERIGLRLEPAEAAMLNAVPAAQLEAIIARARVEPQQRSAFLGYAAAVMLAALTATVATGCRERSDQSLGIRPTTTIRPIAVDPAPDSDQVTRGIRPDVPEPAPTTTTTLPDSDQITRGIRPDRPITGEKGGIRPERPPVSEGIRPDIPVPETPQ